jgi:putative transposase
VSSWVSQNDEPAGSSASREAPWPNDEELTLRASFAGLSRRRLRWNWRRAANAAGKAGWVVNDKRVHCPWRAEGLRVPYRTEKRPLRCFGVAVGSMCPIRPNVV